MKNILRQFSGLLLLLTLNFSLHAQGGAVYVNASSTTTFGNPVFSPILNPFGVKWSKTIPAAGGHALTVGHTDVSGQGENMLLTKFDPSGNIVFSVDFNVAGASNDYGVGVFEDSGTNIFVCGTTDNGGSYQAVILKYQPSGMLTGTATISAPGLNYIATALAIHPTTGNLIVAFSAELTSGDFDYVVKELDPNSFAILNTNKYDYNNLTEVPMGVDINSTSGDIVIVGSSQSSATTWAYALATFDGTTLGYISDTRTNIGGFNGDDPLAYKIDNNNCVYITGRTWNSGSSNFDIKTVKIGSSYSIAWTSTIDVNGGDDYGNSVDIDGSGNVVVGGFCTNNSGKKDFFCIKYNGSTGSEIWRYSEPSINPTGDAALLKLRVNQSTNNIFYISSQKNVSNKNEVVVGKIKANGKKSWFKTISNAVHDVIPSDLEINGNEIYAITILNPVSPSYQVTNYSELELDTAKVYQGGVPNRTKNILLVRFKQNAVVAAKINDKRTEYGALNNFITSTALTNLIGISTLRDIGSYQCYKVLPWMTMDDSISVSRSGRTIKMIPHYATFGLVLPNVGTDTLILKGLLQAPGVVDYAQFNNYYYLNVGANDPEYTNGNSPALVTNTTVPDANINIEPAWDYSVGDPNIRVGVFDTGINFEHLDFGNGSFSGSKIAGGFDYYSNIPLGTTASNDIIGHGTAVADKIAALRNNNYATAGIAGGDGNTNTGVTIYDMKIGALGVCNFNTTILASTQDIYNGLIQGASSNGFAQHVQNHSYSGSGHYGFLLDGFTAAFQNEVVLAAASGNAAFSGTNPCITYAFPASYKDHILMKVGANDATGGRAIFSECGNRLDFIAPGTSDLYSSLSMSGTTVTDTLYYPINPNSGCKWPINGTSFAAPHAAGVAALMLSYANNTFVPNPLYPEDIEHLMELSAKDLTVSPYNVGYDDPTGYGRIDAGKCLSNYHYPSYLVPHYSFTVSASTATQVGGVFENACLRSSMFGQPVGLGKVKRYKISGSNSHSVPTGYNFLTGWELSAGSNLMGINSGTGVTIQCNSISPLYQEDLYLPDATNILSINITSTSASFEGYIYEIFDPNTNTSVGWYPFSPSGSATFAYSLYLKSQTVGIDENLFTENSIMVYPNPTNKKIFFKSRLGEINKIDVELLSSLGQVVYKQKNMYIQDESSIDISGLSPGIYFANLKYNNKTLVKKIVVTN